MVLNDMILNRKYEAIAKIMDQDGGCSLIEALGVLDWVGKRLDEVWQAKRPAVLKQKDKGYDQLKARRLSEMT